MTTPEPQPLPGRMTDEQRQKAADWVNQHWAKKDCPFHGPTNWQLEPVMGEVRTFSGGTLVLGPGTLFPLIVLTCSVCGYSVFVNAVVAGLVPRADQTAFLPPENGG